MVWPKDLQDVLEWYKEPKVFKLETDKKTDQYKQNHPSMTSPNLFVKVNKNIATENFS